MTPLALISDCALYRYRLEREISGAGKVATFVMVNPSTADAVQDDTTIRRVISFARAADAGRLIVVNKFAFRSRDVGDLKGALDPIGPDNDHHIEQALRDADIHVAAWGPLNKLPTHLRTRWRGITRLAGKVGCPLLCLGTAADGHPRHPLMVPGSVELEPWRAA